MTGKETCWPLFFSLLVIYFYQLLLIIFYEKIMHFIIRTPGTYFLCFITHLLPPPYIIWSTSTKIIPLQYLLHNLSSKLISNQKAQPSFMHIMQCYTSKVKDDLGCWFFLTLEIAHEVDLRIIKHEKGINHYYEVFLIFLITCISFLCKTS